MKKFLVIFLVMLFTSQIFAVYLDGIEQLKDFKTMRNSSTDPNWENGNGDCRNIPPGETLTVCDLTGPGRITHIWFTISATDKWYSKLLVLRMYWDGEKTPSVESPIGDFFCMGHGEDKNVNSMPFRVTAGGKARNCYFPMPFGKKAKITVTNEGKGGVGAFYYYIDWQKLPTMPANTAYFHAKYRQEFPCKKDEDYLILDAEGKGHYVGCNLSVRAKTPSWWGEGDDRFYIDGEKVPSIQGTGSEDFLCDAWGIREMDGPIYGCPMMEGYNTNDRTTAYRFNLTDPVVFNKSLKLTIEHKGVTFNENGNMISGFDERFDDFSSVAYWYQIEPHKDFSPLPSGYERLYYNPESIIEGESLIPPSEINGGPCTVQDLGGCSNGKQLFFTPSDKNSSITVNFNVNEDGTYNILMFLTKSWDYGVYKFFLDNKEIISQMDLYSPDVIQTPGTYVGSYLLTKGMHKLQFKAVDKNYKSKGYFFGLDGMILDKKK